MNNGQKNFVSSIDTNILPQENQSVLDALFREYERVIFQSILTAFGLDLFIRDQYGGDVDTVHNIRNIDTDPNMTYKNSQNKQDYDNRGDYSHKDVEGTGTNFQKKKHEARSAFTENNDQTVQDAYEDKPLGFYGKSKNHPGDKSAELDHVISAKSIHDDRGRVLAGLSTVELADMDINLQWTNEHLNRSMRADEIPEYVAQHPELPPEVKRRMLTAYQKAKKAYEKKITYAYYFDLNNPNCRRFYTDVLKSAGKRSIQMGLREVVGFMLTELWFCIKDEIQHSDGTVQGIFSAIGNGLNIGRKRIFDNYQETISLFGQSCISGILSSFTTTICNIFFTTSENLGKILRQAWCSAVSATKILLFSREEYFCDRMNLAAKTLAAGAAMIIGTSIQEALDVQLSKLPIPASLKNTLTVFSGSMCTGLLSISLLFYIDHNPFDLLLSQYYNVSQKQLEKQAEFFEQYCAELQQMDICLLKKEAEIHTEIVQMLDTCTDIRDCNCKLREAAKKLGIEPLWGERSLREAMSDNKWVLSF